METRRICVAIALLAGCTPAAFGQLSNVDSAERFAWGENVGWTNWQPGIMDGVLITATYLGGFIWCENVGWLNVGDGLPGTGNLYANLDGTDFGVNVDPGGNLYGFAWGENIGWVNFGDTPNESLASLTLGRLTGHAWGENVGWLNLDDASLFVGYDELYSDGCSGDGGDQMGCTECPCQNNAPPGTTGGCLNSALTSARLIPSGTTSASAANLCFEMNGGLPDSFGVLTSGAALAPTHPANPCFAQNPGSGIQSISLDGLRCRVQAVLRHGSRPIDSAGFVGPMGPAPNGAWGDCSAGFPNATFSSGQTRHFQAFYRELPGAGCLTALNTSQAVSVTYAP